MIITQLKLSNYRNFKTLNLEFNDKVNVIYGENGSGKTNIIESIYLLSFGRSFRVKDNSNLIKFNEDKFNVYSKFKKEDKEITVNVEFDKKNKIFEVNDRKIKSIVELNKLIKIINFEPKDVLLFKNSPKIRRDFINLSISQKDSKYLDYLIIYNKYLSERNVELKKENPNITLLEIYEDKMIQYSKIIYSYRKKYIDEINNVYSQIYNDITKSDSKICIKYLPFIDNLNNYEEKYKKIYELNRENDIKKQFTSIGIHLEDFEIDLNDKNISKFGSQGQNRIAIIALKLAPYFLIEENDKPIIILDDVLSELDKKNQLNFLELLSKLNQVFITNTYEINFKDFKNYKINKINN